jgi:superfamily I DNA and/or RNA helicase
MIFLTSFWILSIRMNEEIMDFSNELFYHGHLKAHASVKEKTLDKYVITLKEFLRFVLLIQQAQTRTKS